MNYQYSFEEDIKACCWGYRRFVGSIQYIQQTVEHASTPLAKTVNSLSQQTPASDAFCIFYLVIYPGINGKVVNMVKKTPNMCYEK